MGIDPPNLQALQAELDQKTFPGFINDLTKYFSDKSLNIYEIKERFIRSIDTLLEPLYEPASKLGEISLPGRIFAKVN